MLDLFSNPIFVINLTTIIAAIGGIITSLEFLKIKEEFSPKGFFSWDTVRRDFLIVTKRSSSDIDDESPTFLDKLYSINYWIFILVLRLVSLFSLIISVLYNLQVLSVISLSVIIITTLIINLRTTHGMDGSDQMLSIIFITLFFHGLFPHDKTIKDICIWFICSQAVVSYFTAGVAKVISKTWLKGQALSLILTTRSYSREFFAQQIIVNPILGKLGTWTVLLFECTFPIIFIGNEVILLTYIFCGIIFHFLNAIVMGLNVFIWAFLSTYPTIIYCALYYKHSI